MPKSSQPKNWRDVLPIHPAAELFPPMSESELRELGEDIKTHGLQAAIVLYQDQLLDGRTLTQRHGHLIGIAAVRVESADQGIELFVAA